MRDILFLEHIAPLLQHILVFLGLIVTIATIVSFFSAPIIAYINFKVMHGNTVQKADRPDGLMTLWSRLSITTMALFSLAYLWLIVAK